MTLNGKTILITGGTGSFGRAFVENTLTKYKPRKLIVFSRDELKQYDMQQRYGNHPALRYFLGDIRDRARLHRALDGVDIIVHAAALKQVPTLEYNPFEAIKTNILGAENIINEAIDKGVEHVVALSTDKAVNPINLYGATKLCFEKLFVAGNSYSGRAKTRFSVVRYGNVVGSRGSVVPLFLKQKASGVFSVTDERMTRFWITLPQAVQFVMRSLETMSGGEIFVPKIPSMTVIDLIKAIDTKAKIKKIGIRPGEKLHECLLTEHESTHAIEQPDRFIIEPEHSFWQQNKKQAKGKRLPADFRYASDNNTQWLKPDALRRMIQEFTETA